MDDVQKKLANSLDKLRKSVETCDDKLSSEAMYEIVEIAVAFGTEPVVLAIQSYRKNFPSPSLIELATVVRLNWLEDAVIKEGKKEEAEKYGKEAPSEQKKPKKDGEYMTIDMMLRNRKYPITYKVLECFPKNSPQAKTASNFVHLN